MLDFGEILIIGGVALVVIGPERLPQAARTLGSWLGRAQTYVSQMRSEFDREFHLADLRALGEQTRSGARSVETAVRSAVAGVQSEVEGASTALMNPLEANSWSDGASPASSADFSRRYRPRPTIDDLTQEIERLKRDFALPGRAAVGRERFAPRARVNRVRIRR